MSVPAAYLGIMLIWSTTPLAIKWSGENGGFLLGASGRMALGALLCLLLVKFFKVSFPWTPIARRCYMAVSITIYGAMLVTYWGAQFIPSGLVSVLFGLAPIITSILTLFWLGDQQLNLSKWAGMIIGLFGLIIIFNHEFTFAQDSLKGLIAILLAVILHSVSAVWIKQMAVSLSPLAMTTGGLLIALPLYGLTWLLLGHPMPETIPIRMLLAVMYLGIFGSVIGFILYYYVLQRIDAKKVALITLITPVIALFLGQYLNGEIISIKIWLGASQRVAF